MGRLFNRALRWGLVGLVVGPALVYSLMLLVLYADPRCAPGATGGCQLDIAINLTIGLVAGFAVFFLVTLLRGLLRRTRQ